MKSIKKVILSVAIMFAFVIACVIGVAVSTPENLVARGGVLIN